MYITFHYCTFVQYAARLCMSKFSTQLWTVQPQKDRWTDLLFIRYRLIETIYLVR